MAPSDGVLPVGAARALPVVGRFLARRRGRTTRLAGVSLARRTGSAGIATAFLALAIGLAAFAETYRETLARGERDRAAYAVPTDVIVREKATGKLWLLQGTATGFLPRRFLAEGMGVYNLAG